MLIATGNAKGMAKVKGLGPKTAQRIIVDLKDKALKLDLGGDPTEIPMLDVEADSGVKSEAISALTMLGFPAAASGRKPYSKTITNNSFFHNLASISHIPPNYQSLSTGRVP